MKIFSKKVIISIIILAVLLGFLLFYVSIVSSKTVSARLLIEQGSVFVNDREVSEEMVLSKNDKIYVPSSGKASIVLYESIVILMEPETTIIVSDLSKRNLEVYQEKGETWNQITKLFGIESYTIKTSTSVASVRGTGFYLKDSLLLVGEGRVDYDVEDSSFFVEEGKAIETIEGISWERDLTSEENEKVKFKKQESIESLKKVRLLELEKHKKTVDFLKKRYSLTDEDIFSYLNQADRGELDLNELREKSPVKLDSLEKIIKITEKIKELRNSI